MIEILRQDKEDSQVTIFCDIEIPVHRNIFSLFSDNNFEINRIDSGRYVPVVEYKGRYFAGARNIITHFFPNCK